MPYLQTTLPTAFIAKPHLGSKLAIASGIQNMAANVNFLKRRQLPLWALSGRHVFTSVDGDDRLGEEIELATRHDELAAHTPDRGAVVTPEVCDGF